MQYYTLKVINVFRETKDTVTISFKQPGLKKFKYLAGQYLTLIFRINGRRYIRPYSFSSAPGVEQTLDITVKRVPGGIVSNYIVDCLAVDSVVEVMEPMGDFTLQHDVISPDSHIVLWAAGSGITPVISIAKYALYNSLTAHVTLVYGNRNFESAIFNDKLKVLREHFPGSFTVKHFHTKPAISADEMNIINGRIDPDKILSVINSEGNIDNTIHYICGPLGLKESVKSKLKQIGLSDDHIFSEDFELVKDPKKFEHITTKMVTIQTSGAKNSVEVVKGKSILEAGLDALIDMSYSCQTGNCLVCKGRLTKGAVEMIGIEKIPEGLNADERLLCCGYPVSDDVEIVI